MDLNFKSDFNSLVFEDLIKGDIFVWASQHKVGNPSSIILVKLDINYILILDHEGVPRFSSPCEPNLEVIKININKVDWSLNG